LKFIGEQSYKLNWEFISMQFGKFQLPGSWRKHGQQSFERILMSVGLRRKRLN